MRRSGCHDQKSLRGRPDETACTTREALRRHELPGPGRRFAPKRSVAVPQGDDG